MPGMSLSAGTNQSRRRWYSPIISWTDACGPSAASMAAFCVIEHAFEVEWLCTLSIASIHSFGPSPNPSLHPVIACDFENEPQIITRERNSGGNCPAANGTAGGYAK